jgi:5'-nucleotidase
MLVSNYDFSGTPMENKTVPYRIFKKGKLKIGVLGVSIEGRGLIPDNLFGATKYLDPVQKRIAIWSFVYRTWEPNIKMIK